MSLVSISVFLTVIMYLGFGIGLFFYPVELLAKANIFLTNPVGTMEVRSFYGGLEIGLGLFLIYSYFYFGQICPVVLAIFLLTFTLLGRLYGLVIDGAWSNYFIYACMIEGSILLLNIFSYLELKK